MMTLERLKELEEITIEFDKYFETVIVNLEHLEIGLQDIVVNIRTEIEELAKGATKIISDMRKDLEQGRTVISELLRTINSLRSSSSTISPIITTSFAKPMTSPTMQTNTTTLTEPSWSSPFLEKEKEMLELKAKPLSKRTIPSTIQTKRFVLFDICAQFLVGYYKITR